MDNGIIFNSLSETRHISWSIFVKLEVVESKRYFFSCWHI